MTLAMVTYSATNTGSNDQPCTGPSSYCGGCGTIASSPSSIAVTGNTAISVVTMTDFSHGGVSRPPASHRATASSAAMKQATSPPMRPAQKTIACAFVVLSS